MEHEKPPKVYLPDSSSICPPFKPADNDLLQTVDFLFPAVRDIELRAAFAILENPVKTTLQLDGNIIPVFLGYVGPHLVAIVTCGTGQSGLHGTHNTCYEVITTMRPAYGVVCGGPCMGLNAAELGNIVVSDKLTTYGRASVNSQWDGVRPECGVTLVAAFRSAKFGWRAPAGNPDVHVGEIVSVPSLGWGHGHEDELSKMFGGALAAESEGGGIYAACARKKVEWIIVKGIASLGCHGSDTAEWETCAAVNSFSLIQKALKELPKKIKSVQVQDVFSVREQWHLVQETGAIIGNRTVCPVKEGSPSPNELQSLAKEIVKKWKTIGRLLGLQDWQLEQIEVDYRGDVYEQSYQSLRRWTQVQGSSRASYTTLVQALRHPAICLHSIAETFCVEQFEVTAPHCPLPDPLAGSHSDETNDGQNVVKSYSGNQGRTNIGQDRTDAGHYVVKSHACNQHRTDGGQDESKTYASNQDRTNVGQDVVKSYASNQDGTDVAQDVTKSYVGNQDRTDVGQDVIKSYVSNQDRTDVDQDEVNSATKGMAGMKIRESEPIQEEAKVEKACKKEKIITFLDQGMWEMLSEKLNPPRKPSGDYRTLAGKLEYNVEKIWCFGSQPDPTLALLRHWYPRERKGTIEQLCCALLESERNDVVELIEEWIDKRGCNCKKCQTKW